MTTIPPEQARSDNNKPHQHREMAESFGADPERYDSSRPSYPGEMVQKIVAASPGRDVLDVGIGTGIAARQFRTAGCTVTGVDVDARMAEFARHDGFEVEVTAFETWEPAGREFDAVIAGQTWHWVNPVAGAAKAADVLRPGGRLAVFWNADQPHSDLARAFGEVYGRVTPGSLVARRWLMPTAGDYSTAAVDGYVRLGGKVVEGVRQVGGFGKPEQWRFDWERVYTRDEWIDQVPTTGDHTQFSSGQLDDLLTGLGAAIDAQGGSFTMRYATLVVTAARTAG